MGDAKLFLFATIESKPEDFEKVKAALDELIPVTLAEPGCHVFSAFVNRETEHTFNLFECFDDEEALNDHYAQDYTKGVFALFEESLRSPVKVVKMSATSSSSWEQFHA